MDSSWFCDCSDNGGQDKRAARTCWEPNRSTLATSAPRSIRDSITLPMTRIFFEHCKSLLCSCTSYRKAQLLQQNYTLKIGLRSERSHQKWLKSGSELELCEWLLYSYISLIISASQISIKSDLDYLLSFVSTLLSLNCLQFSVQIFKRWIFLFVDSVKVVCDCLKTIEP